MARDDPSTAFSARPTVRIEGQSLPLLSANLVRLKVREMMGGMTSLELVINDTLSFSDGTAGYGATAASPLKLGAGIKIFVGETTAPQEIFDGGITAIESEVGPDISPQFTVLAEDRLFTARRSRRTRTFEKQSPADVAKAIAADHGLTPEVGDGFDTPAVTQFQNNETDLAFLRRILARHDGDAQVVGTTLQVRKRAVPRNQLSLALKETLLRGRFTVDLAEQATEVSVASFDPASGTPVSVPVQSGDLGPGSGQSGPQAAAKLFTKVRAPAGTFEPMTDSEARAVAEAFYGQRARRFVRADATAQGSGQLRVGTQVTLTGLNPFFNNDYLVIDATHRFDLESGYLTDFIGESAFMGAGA